MDRPIHDVDIASSSYPEETKAIFDRTVDVGIEHGTVLVLENGQEYEITTFRTEDVYVDYRRPSSVSFVRSLEEDLKRRDFTVNSFALNKKEKLVDLFHGTRRFGKQGPPGQLGFLMNALTKMRSGSCEAFVFRPVSVLN